MTYSHQDLNRIRSLAEQVLAIARDEPRMASIKKRWADVNALRKPDRAPVWCRPVGCWKEIITDNMLKCTDPGLRQIEYDFLQVLHKRTIDDDHPVEGYFALNAVFDCQPKNIWGMDIRHHTSDTEGGAWAYDPPLREIGNLARLQVPVFTYNAEKTRTRQAQIEDALGGVLPVRIVAGPLLHVNLVSDAAELHGLEQIMINMLDAPDFIHALMAHLRDAVLSALDQLEATGLITPNNTGPMTGSDPIGTTGANGKLTCHNLWSMTDSQEFDQVSPALWEEFCLNYQKPILARFGLTAYGCCENLTRKIDGVLSIPNLRIFTCSAWTNLAAVQEKLGRKYCIMWRQKASDVVFPADAKEIRNNLMNGVKQLQGHYYQIVLRELETLAGHPNRLHEWTKYAKEAAEIYA